MTHMYTTTKNVKRITDIYEEEEIDVRNLEEIMMSHNEMESYFLEDPNPDDIQSKKEPGQDEEDSNV